MKNSIQAASNTNTKSNQSISPKTKGIVNIWQGAGATLGALSIIGAEIGRANGYLTQEEANKLGGAGLLGLLISTSPTVYNNIQKSDFLEKISNDILNKSLTLLSF